MNSITTALTASPVPISARPFLSILRRIKEGTLKLTTPEGMEIQFGDGSEPVADIQLRDWSALRRIFQHGDIGVAECYRDGLIECRDLTRLIRLGIRNQEHMETAIHGHPLLQLGYRLQHALRRNTVSGSRKNISAHYDLGNDFYQLWLDKSMTYSSALFPDDNFTDLESAQELKYQRLLDLTGAKPGDSILEIGCGWGGFAEYAARQGMKVHGVTLSIEQLNFAENRIQEKGLSDRVDFELRDYRFIKGQFDHIVSIEMLEAVGEQYWGTYLNKLHEVLKPGGKAAIQVITIDDEHFEGYRSRSDFIQSYIFPGGMLPSIEKFSGLIEQNHLELSGVDYFGKDYAETLRRWRSSFEAHLPAIRKMEFDDNFVKLWRFYLAYCEAGFDESRIDVAHLLLSKS